METGDFNRDGDGDILWRSGGSLSLWLLSATGVQTMTAATPNAPLASRAYMGDLDGDGVSDVVWVFDQSFLGYQALTWMMNPGSTTPRSASSSTSQTDMVQGLGNFDNDSLHRADILYRTPGTGSVSIQFNGAGQSTIGGASMDWQIKGVGDFNGDRFSDILWYNVNSGQVFIWAMQGTTAVANVSPGTSAPAGGWTIQGVADVDHDGVSDIVWRHTNGMVNTWIMKDPGTVREFGGPYTVASSTTFAGVVDLGPPAPANAIAPPINEPFCGAASGRLRNPGFADYEQWWGASFYGNPGTFLADVDGDTKADLIGIGPGYIGVIRSNGAGFGSYETWNSASGSWWGSHGTLVGDVDGDNQADLFVLNDTSVRVLRSNGTSFSPFDVWPFSFFSNVGINGIYGTLIGDMDGDRRSELVALNDNGMLVLHWTGSGFPSVLSLGSTLHGSHGTFMGDIDGDGKADLVAIGDGYIGALRSTGLAFGSYETWATTTTIYGSVGTFLTDVDGDGRADVLAIDADRVRVSRSTGSSFGQIETWWGHSFVGSHATLPGDVDGNGKVDLVSAGDGYVAAIQSE